VKERLNAGTTGIEEAAILDILAQGHVTVEDLKSVGCMLNLVPFFLHSPLVLYSSVILIFFLCQHGFH